MLDKIFEKEKIYRLVFTILIAFLLVATFPSGTILSLKVDNKNIIQNNSEFTTVSIVPSSLNVSPGETFIIGVYCVPTQPIEGYEFDLDFNASLIHADLVTPGGFFGDYSTYFNDGSINNDDGYINNVYELILEEGEVSNPGYFANITFTAKLNTGVCYLNLEDVGVSNQTGYLPIFIENGSVIVGDNPPTASFVWVDTDGSGYGTVIELDASISSDDEGIVTYNWDFDNDGLYNDASGIMVSYDFGDTNIHTVGLEVIDTIGQIDTFLDVVQAHYKNIKSYVEKIIMKYIEMEIFRISDIYFLKNLVDFDLA